MITVYYSFRRQLPVRRQLRVQDLQQGQRRALWILHRPQRLLLWWVPWLTYSAYPTSCSLLAIAAQPAACLLRLM